MTTEPRLPEAWRGTSLELAGMAGALLDHLPAAVIAVDPARTITYWNPEAERVFGWRREEIFGRSLGEFLDSDDPLATVLAGQRWQGELRIRSDAGGFVNAWGSADPLRTPDGVVSGAVAAVVPGVPPSVHDQLSTVLDSVDAAIMMRRADGEVVYANTAAAVAMGFERPDQLLAEAPEDWRARYVVVDAHGNPVPHEELPAQ